MELFEEYVLAFLTSKKHVFVNPQFSIRSETGGDWSCPDFVALDFKSNEVSVVEVSSAYDIKDLIAKVKNRDKHWLEKLREQLQHDGVISSQCKWKFGVKLFIRSECMDRFKKNIGDVPDVEVMEIEKLGFPWSPTWHEPQKTSQ